MAAIPILHALGELRPVPPDSPSVSTSPASGRPAALDDRDWLARRYRQAGDIAIAEELDVSRGTVIRARRRLGIASEAPGRRRGTSARNVALPLVPAADVIAERIREESRHDGPAPTPTLVAARVRALHEALEACDRPSITDAYVSLASACGLALDHLQRLEAA